MKQLMEVERDTGGGEPVLWLDFPEMTQELALI
jgi:hypothetical protein